MTQNASVKNRKLVVIGGYGDWSADRAKAERSLYSVVAEALLRHCKRSDFVGGRGRRSFLRGGDPCGQRAQKTPPDEALSVAFLKRNAAS